AVLADDKRRELAQIARVARYRAGETIFNQGDTGNSLYILSQGRVELLIGVGDQAHPISVLEEGAFFGEMALLTGEPRSATARTLTPSDIVVLTKRDLEILFHEYPDVPLEISRVIGERQAKTSQAQRRLEQALESRLAQAGQPDPGAEEATREVFTKIKAFFKLT
ncbi:MAG: cyclic nucleotide-binding domain-containing protein, partial [Cyanobacteria bacterium REEB65]|nr:cyclic nucleotide-binding domain-containing protein [Cyanobacteria bacterium REEB65]